MKVIFLGMFLLVIISCAQAKSKEDFTKNFTSKDKSLVLQSNEQAHKLNGNSDEDGNIEVSTRLNHKNEHKHEMFVATRYLRGGGARVAGFGGGGMGKGGMGGGGMGKGGMGGGGKGGGGKGGGGGGGRMAGGVAGGAAAGLIGGGIIGGAVANHNNNQVKNKSDSSATTTSSARTHLCVSTLILCLSFWILSHFH